MAYRILSLDGGGAWALIQVRALIAIYGPERTGHEVLADFDLAAANSGGSLVLGGLLEDLTLKDLAGYFLDKAKRLAIFSPSHSVVDRLLHSVTGFGPKYSADDKLRAIQALTPSRGAMKLTAATAGIVRAGSPVEIRLLIVGFDYDRNRAAFFRSWTSGGASLGTGSASTLTLAEAIHASTNAPVNFFDAPASFTDNDSRYWDGGITGCNNPVLAAVTEAVVNGQAPDEIAALSIGTASVSLPLAARGAPKSPLEAQRGESSLLADLRKLSTAILDDPPDMASFIAHVMTAKGVGVPAPATSRIVRLSPLLAPAGQPGAWTTPPGLTPQEFDYLAGLDMDAVAQAEVDAIDTLAAKWIAGNVRNQPIRMDGRTLLTQLGDDSFAAGLASWRAIR